MQQDWLFWLFVWALALTALLLSLGGVYAHDAAGASDWIGEHHYTVGPKTSALCCGRNDCGRLDKKLPFKVEYTKEGISVSGTFVYFIDPDPRKWARIIVNETIPYAKVQPSEDGEIWRCQYGGPSSPPRDPNCFFAPPPGS